MNITKKVIQILKEHCEVSLPEILPEHRLQEDLGLDSLSLFALAVEVENSFEIELGENPEDPPKTVAEIVELISCRLGESQ